MGELILCKTSMAANSYYIEEASINIYSLEELCYYIYNNAYLLKDDFVDESLCLWIKDELGQVQLCSELLGLLNNDAGLNLLVGHLLKFSDYLTKSEIKKCQDIISSFEGKSEAEILKLRADHMISGGRFLDAIFYYESILEKKLSMEERLKGDILHNLGCALSGLFFFKRAGECFEQAYRLNRESVSLDMLLYSCLFAKDEESFELYVDRYQVLPEVASKIRTEFNDRINSSANMEFKQQLTARMAAGRDEVEKEYIYREIIDTFKADYRSLRMF